MQAATSVPVDITKVIEGLIVLFVASPLLIRAVFRLRRTEGAGLGGSREGMERVTALATIPRPGRPRTAECSPLAR